MLPGCSVCCQSVTRICSWVTGVLGRATQPPSPPLLDPEPPEELPLLDPLLLPDELPELEPLLLPLEEPLLDPLLLPEELPLLDPLLLPEELPLLEAVPEELPLLGPLLALLLPLPELEPLALLSGP
jgi:hypothetical protein